MVELEIHPYQVQNVYKSLKHAVPTAYTALKNIMVTVQKRLCLRLHNDVIYDVSFPQSLSKHFSEIIFFSEHTNSCVEIIFTVY